MIMKTINRWFGREAQQVECPECGAPTQQTFCDICGYDLVKQTKTGMEPPRPV